MHLRAILLVLAATAALGCASSGNKVAGQASCGLSVRDSVFIGPRPVYRDCDVQQAARLISIDAHPNFRPDAAHISCYFADLEFVVDTIGRPETETARVLRSNDERFGLAELQTLSAWRYEPALREGKKVRQIVDSHQTVSVMVAVVPAGSPPPSRPPSSQRPPSC
jgi:hypothetical protein